jgi:hypothetical protein
MHFGSQCSGKYLIIVVLGVLLGEDILAICIIKMPTLCVYGTLVFFDIFFNQYHLPFTETPYFNVKYHMCNDNLLNFMVLLCLLVIL